MSRRAPTFLQREAIKVRLTLIGRERVEKIKESVPDASDGRVIDALVRLVELDDVEERVNRLLDDDIRVIRAWRKAKEG